MPHKLSEESHKMSEVRGPKIEPTFRVVKRSHTTLQEHVTSWHMSSAARADFCDQFLGTEIFACGAFLALSLGTRFLGYVQPLL